MERLQREYFIATTTTTTTKTQKRVKGSKARHCKPQKRAQRKGQKKKDEKRREKEREGVDEQLGRAEPWRVGRRP
jgi:hypothetical protein